MTGNGRTFGARRESEARVCDYGEEGDPCKAEQRDYSCERVLGCCCQQTRIYVGTCTNQMPMPSTSGRAEILGLFVPCSSEESGLNPERKLLKLLPGSTMVVEIEATGCHFSKARNGVHASRALFVS